MAERQLLLWDDYDPTETVAAKSAAEFLRPIPIVTSPGISSIREATPIAMAKIWMLSLVNTPGDRDRHLDELFASGNTPAHIALYLREKSSQDPLNFARARVEATLHWVQQTWNHRRHSA